MSTEQMSERPLYVQCPSFGFGPASTTAFLLDALGGRFPMVLVGHGLALSFLRSKFPEAGYLDADTSTEEGLQDVRAAVPLSSLFVSNTDPVFATWALEHGYRVGVVDTLDWMWSDVPKRLGDAEFHLVQWFFGSQRSASAEVGLSPQVVGPLVEKTRASSPELPRHRAATANVVISFGGMTVPGSDARSLTYARWVLRSLLSTEVMDGIEDVHVVGGLPGIEEAAYQHVLDAKVHAHVALVPERLKALYADATHIVATPGLTTIYELASMGAEPLLLPGFSMSMVLQSRAIATSGYVHVAEWDWAEPVCDSLMGLPEEEGLAVVARRLDRSITETDGDSVARAFSQYRARKPGHRPLRIDVPGQAADPATVFARAVSEALSR